MKRNKNQRGLIRILFLFIVVILVSVFAGIRYEKGRSQDRTNADPGNINNAQNVSTNPESDLRAVADEVLSALNSRDYARLEELSSKDGLSWNIYPNLDLTGSALLKDEISEIPNNKRIYFFGYTDGKGDPIHLTIGEYLDKWLYSRDYLSADEVAVNTTLGGGNSINSIVQDAEGRDFIAYHFKGFDPKYEGMDWTTLYLVFDLENGQYRLRALAKDNWTI